MLKNFSHYQRRSLLITFLLLCLCLALWIVLAPRYSAYNYYKAKESIARLKAENIELRESNLALRQEIDRLKKDHEYLEKVAREKYGLIRKNEMIYKFDSGKKSEE